MWGVTAVILAGAAAILAGAVAESHALGPGIEHEVFGPERLDYAGLDYTGSIISLDPQALRSYDLHRYIIDGQIVVLEGAFHPQGMRDIRLSSHQDGDAPPQAANLGNVTGAARAHAYGAIGSGIVVAVVDSGTDFSNPDMVHAVARDENNHPLMLDPDGQGIILTNNTFRAFVDPNGALRNAFNHTVYVDGTGVYLASRGAVVSVYNSLYPLLGDSPVLEGTLLADFRIGHDSHDYIPSKSGTYHLGVSLQLNHGAIQAVPVLVTDPNMPGVYDTVIPDMGTSWQDHAGHDSLDLDFTDDTPITMGSGNELLVYDADDDGMADYSAGMLGARVLDVYGVFGEETPEGYVPGAVNTTLLEPVDADGRYVGIMTDISGHGTAVAGLIAAQGEHTYRIYNDSRTYAISGVAPGATILPVKALWYGSTEYGWMWAAGMDNDGSGWAYSGERRAHIISNSWGVPTFPLLEAAPGYDYLSLLSDVLSVPGSLDGRYPGTLMVSSAGNSGQGYGSMSLPGSSLLALTAGATFNAGYTEYGFFAEQPRFGNSTEHYGHLAQLSSRGPGVLGAPKPDILSVGAFGFAPAWVTRDDGDDSYEAFGAFGGTSMAAPLVAGGAAVVMGELEDAGTPYTPFTIKNILMSTAADTGNDPMAQGAGRLDAGTAVAYVRGDGPFAVTNDASYGNVREALSGALDSLNRTELGLGTVYVPDRPYPSAEWFAGHLEPGSRSSTTFTIQNPNPHPITVRVQPETAQELESHESRHTTEPRQQDPILNETGVYAPNYIRLSDAREHQSLSDLFAVHDIPESDLLVINLNFEFDDFMNSTTQLYADDFTIASLYMYDWFDSNADHMVDYGELALVNRAGSWGTGQELRVSYPHVSFAGVPVVGVYPVPVQASYWEGITDRNSTAIDYTMTASYYGYGPWEGVWTDSSVIVVPPGSSYMVEAAISVPPGAAAGVHQGFVRFESDHHTVSVPVSYAVAPRLDGEAVLADGDGGGALLRSGLVQGSFDMSGRYPAGEWRHHHVYVPDDIESVVVEVSWLSNHTHVGVFVVDPTGALVQTNTDPGVFGDLAYWPSSDWLGRSVFSEGGGFYPVRNWNDTTTIIQVQTPEPGVYTILSHVSLHGGEGLYEPIRVSVRPS